MGRTTLDLEDRTKKSIKDKVSIFIYLLKNLVKQIVISVNL